MIPPIICDTVAAVDIKITLKRFFYIYKYYNIIKLSMNVYEYSNTRKHLILTDFIKLFVLLKL